MGFFKAIGGSIASQSSDLYREIIRWDNDDNNILMKKITTENGVITDKSRLFVQVGQCAVYTDNGAIKDIISTPDMYFMDTSSPGLFQTNIFKGITDTFLETAKRVAYNGEAINSQDVYFFSITEKTGLSFITPDTIMYDDPDWGPMEVIVSGKYAIKVVNPINLLLNLAGNKDVYTVGDINIMLEPLINSLLATAISNLNVSFDKISSLQNKLGNSIIEYLNKEIAEYGIEFTDIIVSSVEVPDEIKKSIRERVSIKMKATSVDNNGADIYTKLNTAEAIKDMANNTASDSSTILGVGVGANISNLVNKNIDKKN